ncbi:nucleoporin [Trichophyton mentagrophytes]|nr:nucleoporin [Trichophyton mentagrophytes]
MLVTHRGTKVDIGPTTQHPAATVAIKSHGAQQRAKISTTTSSSARDTAIRDEDAFAKRYLASQSSIYFRKRKTYPRSFFWRVIEDSTCLELRAVDLTKSSQDHHESNVAIRLEFEDAIVPHGVALADVEGHESLSVFVLLRSKQLYTFTMRPEYFRKLELIDENINDWCKTCSPAPLGFSFPHRLYAASPYELFISIDSGSLLRLTRKVGDDGSHWFPVTFDEKSWSFSLRGLVKWSGDQTVQYDGRSLDPNTPNAIATTSDQAFVFVVGLNHSLKVWNLASQKLVGSKDLLNRTNQSQDASPLALNPDESAFIRVFTAERASEGSMYYVVTYSPQDDGQFKFWAVGGGITGQLVIEDLFPDSKLQPADPDPSGSVFWNVVDFQIKSMDEGRNMALWVLWKSHNSYRLYSLHFDLVDLANVWNSNWTMTSFTFPGNNTPPSPVRSDTTDTQERWIEYLFAPGRYSPEILRTALAIYQDAMKLKHTRSLSSNSASSSLQQDVCTTITQSVTLRQLPDTEMDFSKYYRDLEAKWQQFWQIVEDINKKTQEAISLAYDAYSDLPWLIFSGGSAIIRECDSTELMLHNDGETLGNGIDILESCWPHRNIPRELGENPGQSASLANLAMRFRKLFPAQLSESCRTALDNEIFAEPSLSAAERVEAFHSSCGFAEFITEELFEAGCASIEETVGYKGLTNETFFSIIDTLPLSFPGKDSELQSTAFGRNAIAHGAREVLVQSRQIIHDLLLFAVFVETEVNLEAENTQFDGPMIFSTLIDLLKEYELMIWLATNVRPRQKKNRPDSTSVRFASKGCEFNHCTTVLEDLFAIHIKPQPAACVPQMYAMTQQIQDVISWVTRQGEVSLSNILVFIQCDLLASDNIELASDFLRFQPSTAWATYVKGRLYLARSNFDTAAIYFQKAAYLLSYGKAVGNLHEMSSNLLDIVSVDNFYNGLPRYFQHIVNLFELSRAFIHVADFANLALQALGSSPKKNETDLEHKNLRSDLLSRLFHASLKTCRFDDAYSALARYTDLALQKSALTSLTTTILTAYGPGTAGLQKVLRLPLSLTPHLCSHVDDVLASLASKQSPLGPSIGQTVPLSSWQGTQSPPEYHRVLKAYRIARNDIRGAAEISYQTVSRLRDLRDRPTASKVKFFAAEDASNDLNEDDIESRELRNELLSLINLLACMEKNEAYIVVEQYDPNANRPDSMNSILHRPSSSIDDPFTSSTSSLKNPFSHSADNRSINSSDSPTLQNHNMSLSRSTSELKINRAKRIVITLEDLRKEYQSELDRVSRIRSGDWEFGAVEDLEMAGV